MCPRCPLSLTADAYAERARGADGDYGNPSDTKCHQMMYCTKVIPDVHVAEYTENEVEEGLSSCVAHKEQGSRIKVRAPPLTTTAVPLTAYGLRFSLTP